MRLTSGFALGRNISGVYNYLKPGPMADKPMYERQDGSFFLVFGGHWKVEKWDNQNLLAAEGFIKALPSLLEDCPKDVGKRWSFFRSAKFEDGITVECLGKAIGPEKECSFKWEEAIEKF